MHSNHFILKYYIIAGEASGDLHAANLMRELTAKDPTATFRVWGGDLMQAAGGTLVKHYRDLAFMGFIEVVRNLRTILRNIDFCKADIKAFAPDAIIFVDYPGFNLRIAGWAKKMSYYTVYYISPQVWAWHQKRVHLIKQVVDLMIVILPFEVDFYKKFNYTAHYVGHPLLDAIAQTKKEDLFLQENNLSTTPIIALLPGSRRQEIKQMLPIMLSVVTDYPNYQFVIAGAPSIEKEFYEEMMPKEANIQLLSGKTYALLQHSFAALVTSGTATLETALFRVPQVVCYKGNSVSFWLAKRLVEIKYISLVNLIMDKPIVKELIQTDLTKENLIVEIEKLLNPSHRAFLAKEYALLADKLGNKGASERAASLILTNKNK